MATPVVDPDAAIQKRVYVGGLHPEVTADLLAQRFAKYGSLSNVQIAKDMDNQCRGFAHFTIDTTPKQWNNCLSTYHGSTWKGHKLQLAEAKPDHEQREAIQAAKDAKRQERKRKREERCPTHDGVHAKDLTLVNDDNVNTRNGKWKRGRYGRAIAVMRLAKPDGSKMVFDPTHYKNNLEKIFNVNARMKRTRDLPMAYEDYEHDMDLQEDQLADDHDAYHDAYNDAYDNADVDMDAPRPSLFANSDDDNEAPRPSLFANSDDDDNAPRPSLFADSDQDDEEHDENAPRPSLFAHSDDENENENKPKDAAKWMFDSEDDEEGDEDMDIKIQSVFEGEKGRQRLEMQSKFKGDDRFKLDDTFMDEDEDRFDDDDDDDDENDRAPGATGDDLTKGLSDEKNQSLDVLRSMFGDIQVFTPTKQANTWSATARYDPDADDAANFLVDKGKKDADDDHDSDDSLHDITKDALLHVESAAPEVSKDKHFSVNVNLKPLFSTSDEPFTLFGGQISADEDEEDEEAPTTPPAALTDDAEAAPASFFKPAAQNMELGSLFFFHDDPKLVNKSCYNYDPQGIFQRQQDNWDDTEKAWRQNRVIVSQVLKKRDKNATRLRQKLANKDLK
ncbi:hypothetical protein BC940DRAFT_293417 [Gongronella butleri]|nr:hypothetical protein BC940DRAFT_293417 [Gongronella butleri]